MPLRLLFVAISASVVAQPAATVDDSLSSLSDLPVLGDDNMLQSLSSITAWTATDAHISVPAIVPGDLISDLARAKVIGDPLFEVNFESTVWDQYPWTFSRTFDDELSRRTPGSDVLLVFDGVKMAATVTFNGVVLGDCTDQFLRFNFSVGALMQPTNNVLAVTFGTSVDGRNAEGRWMACSGAWDWAPYSNTSSVAGDKTFTKGIVKDVYLVPVSAAAVAHVVPHVTYTGMYPTAPLTDGFAAPFAVSVDVVLWRPLGMVGVAGATVSAACEWSTEIVSVTLPALALGESVVPLILPVAANVSLWWPVGLGSQRRYSLNVTIAFSASGVVIAAAPRKIGFRTAFLVTTNDTACVTALSCVNGDGSADFTMRFKINGADFVALGANMIPMEELEQRESAMAYKALLAHAVNGRHTMLRVWGGGKYLPLVFYDTCDKLGLVLFHDVMYGTPWFGGTGSVPRDTPLQISELVYNIRRLAAFASIALWSGGNEFYPLSNFVPMIEAFLMPTITQIDRTRAVWPTSPSQGWSAGVNTLTGLPNGSPFVVYQSSSARGVTNDCGIVQDGVDYDHGFVGKAPPAASPSECCALCAADLVSCWAATLYQGVCYFKPAGGVSSSGGADVVSVFPSGHTPPLVPRRIFETHGPYQHGSGFATVNGNGAMDVFPANIPPTLQSGIALGPQMEGNFASEFGASVFSSAESMAATLKPSDFSAHAPVMFTRNYPCDNFIQVYFGPSFVATLNETSLFSLQRATFFCMLGVALQQKSDIETRRSSNAWGTLTWQLGEIWPTGGWGSIEYGTVNFTEGQVLGGRWKPLHYFMQQHLYAPTIILCGTNWSAGCLVKHDGAIAGFIGNWSATIVRLSDGLLVPVGGGALNLPRGGGASTRVCVDRSPIVGQCTPIAAVLSAAGCASNGTDCILQFRLFASTGDLVDAHDLLLVSPMLLSLPTASVTFVVADATSADGCIEVTLVAQNGVALFVTLTTTEQGVWSQNVFVLRPGAQNAVKVLLMPVAGAVELSPTRLSATLRVEHVAFYQS